MDAEDKKFYGFLLMAIFAIIFVVGAVAYGQQLDSTTIQSATVTGTYKVDGSGFGYYLTASRGGATSMYSICSAYSVGQNITIGQRNDGNWIVLNAPAGC